MTMATLERSILAELKQVTNRNKLRLKDIFEWSTSEEKVKQDAQEGDVVVYCPTLNVWCAIPKETGARS